MNVIINENTRRACCWGLTITVLDIIRRPVFYLKHDVSETGFCLRVQVEPLSVGLNI
jgi:hypothetical protein